MQSFGIFLVFVALVAYGEARVAGEPAANNPVPLADLIAKAQADIAKLGQQLHDNLHLPDHDTIVNTLTNHSSTLVTNVKNYVNQMSEEVKAKSPEFEKLWTSVKTTLNKAVDDVAAQIPVAKDQAAQLEAKFFKGVQTIAKQSEIAAQTVNQNTGQIQEDVAKLAKKVVDLAVQATQQLNSQLQQQTATKTSG